MDRDESRLTVTFAVMLGKVAVKPAPSAIVLLVQLPGVLQLPLVTAMFQVPLWPHWPWLGLRTNTPARRQRATTKGRALRLEFRAEGFKFGDRLLPLPSCVILFIPIMDCWMLIQPFGI